MSAIGQLYITDAAREAFERNNEDLYAWVATNASRLWDAEVPGELADKRLSTSRKGKMIVSVHKLKDHTIIWIIIDPARCTTSISLPHET